MVRGAVCGLGGFVNLPEMSEVDMPAADLDQRFAD